MSANATPGRREKSKTQNRTTFFPRFIAVVLILLAFVGFLLYLLQPVTFTYRGMTMEAVPGVAVNRYDPDGFYTDEKGRVQYTSKGLPPGRASTCPTPRGTSTGPPWRRTA